MGSRDDRNDVCVHTCGCNRLPYTVELGNGMRIASERVARPIRVYLDQYGMQRCNHCNCRVPKPKVQAA